MIFLYLTIFRKLYFLREAFDFDSFFFFFFLFYFLRFRRILSLLFFNPLFRTFFLFRLHFIFFELRSNSFHCSKTPFAESSFLSMHWMRGGFRFQPCTNESFLLFYFSDREIMARCNNRTWHDSKIFLNETVCDEWYSSWSKN